MTIIFYYRNYPPVHRLGWSPYKLVLKLSDRENTSCCCWWIVLESLFMLITLHFLSALGCNIDNNILLYSRPTSPTLEVVTANLQTVFVRFQLALINVVELVLNSEKTKCKKSFYTGVNCLSIWLDAKLSFKVHEEHLTKRSLPQCFTIHHW